MTDSSEEAKTTYNDVPECPYCGFLDHDWWDGWMSSSEVREGECPSCNKSITTIKHVAFSFTTKPDEQVTQDIG